ncbi:MAG: ParB/RepB/Spo0J family partition protein [Parvularculaceae bacterium]
MPKSKSIPKLTLSASRDIPFNQLTLSQWNVRRIKAGVSIEELAEDIARRTLLQSLTVRAVLDEAGAETGIYEIPAGGRRFRALELLVKQKRLATDAPIPCVIRTEGLAEEDSLAENIQRAPLHPLDQFRAFKALREKGKSEEEIAAAFFVSASVVRQRLKLAAVSDALLEAYAEDAMTLDQLMAFTVNPDRQRQEEVWLSLSRSHSREPFHIRRMLTEGAVRASDKRALYVGLADYEQAGGAILRDLFQEDDGGFLQDAGLLNRLCAEKMDAAVDAISAEGWRWVHSSTDLPYGYQFGMRRLVGEQPQMTAEEKTALDAFKAEQNLLEETHAGDEELPEEVDRRLGELEAAIESIEERPQIFDAAEIAIAGAFVTLDRDGRLVVQRGFVRPEDEPAVADVEAQSGNAAIGQADAEGGDQSAQAGAPSSADEEVEEDDATNLPLSDRLLTDLTQWRTIGLRETLGRNPEIAFVAALHAIALRLFYRSMQETCLQLNASEVAMRSDAAGLADSIAANAIEVRHDAFIAQMPADAAALWGWLLAADPETRSDLFAHCVALTVNAVHEPYNRRPRAMAHADALAETLVLDMNGAGWRPTAEGYFARVTKAQILDAVREAKGEDHALRLSSLKKLEMAAAAEELVGDSGWLPEILRTRTMVGRPDTDEDRVAYKDASDILGKPADYSGDDPQSPAIAAE